MTEILNCIVVGAGPAGAAAAYNLAKQGRSVLVLDKASLPRYKPCGGGVSPAIAEWFDFDFSPAIDNKISKVRYTWQMGDAQESELKNVQPMWMVKRDKFDYFLVDRARQLGAVVQDNTEVKTVVFSNNCWQIKTDKGDFQASYLIAADGTKGLLSEALGFETRPQFLGATLDIETTVPDDRRHTAQFDFGSLKNGYIWCFPKSDGYSISAGYIRDRKGKAEELKKQLTNYAAKLGIDTSNSQYGEYPMNLWLDDRPLHVQNALLAGEAAGIVDPLTGEGIRPAIFTGIKAAEAIVNALQGDSNALENYTNTIQNEWGSELVLAQRLAGLFYQFPKIAYKLGVKRPAAAQVMGKVLVGELGYRDITEQAMKKLKSGLIPGMK
jgi:geranylgeranyl reductase family protein